MHVHVFPRLFSCSFLQMNTEVSGFVYVCVCGKLTLYLGVQIIYYNLELPQSHISQVGGLQTSFHKTLADVRHVWKLMGIKIDQTNTLNIVLSVFEGKDKVAQKCPNISIAS